MSVDGEAGRGTSKTYVVGFVLSVLLTLAAYVLVVNGVSSGWTLVILIIALAIIQFFVQLIFFLHLGRESKPRWNLMVFLFMLMVVLIVVVGSLWIMASLNYHHETPSSPDNLDNYIIQDEGIKNR